MESEKEREREQEEREWLVAKLCSDLTVLL